MKKFEELEALVAGAKDDAQKFHEKGNSSAGTRLRKALQAIKLHAHEYKKAVQDEKNTNKAK